MAATRRRVDTLVHVPDAGPQTEPGGNPPMIPNAGTIVIADNAREERNRMEKFTGLGCLLMLVMLLAGLWMLTGCVAVVALLN